MKNKLVLGFIGFGVVGEGLYRVLAETNLNIVVKKICIRNPLKKRTAPVELFTSNVRDILDDPAINVVVEMTNDPIAAFLIVSDALLSAKHVVSANKKMIAENYEALLDLQATTGVSLLYESATCASIPVLRNLEEYYDNDMLHSLRGIVNGSTNYVLSRMAEGCDEKQALMQAQQLGFAESDPSLDMHGYDAAYTWCLILNHAFGILLPPENLVFTGIQHISADDTRFGISRGFHLRLVAQAHKLADEQVSAFILPQFIALSDPLAFVRDEFNGLLIRSHFADEQFFYGKGAGALPTASALLSDIAALRYNYRYEYKKCKHHRPHSLTTDVYLRVYFSFTEPESVPREYFEWIEEWHVSEDRSYLVGVIHLQRLSENHWWKEDGCSLILMPEPLVTDPAVKRIKRRSLELAGLS